MPAGDTIEAPAGYGSQIQVLVLQKSGKRRFSANNTIGIPILLRLPNTISAEDLKKQIWSKLKYYVIGEEDSIDPPNGIFELKICSRYYHNNRRVCIFLC
jgi:hypothetical protein